MIIYNSGRYIILIWDILNHLCYIYITICYDLKHNILRKRLLNMRKYDEKIKENNKNATVSEKELNTELLRLFGTLTPAEADKVLEYIRKLKNKPPL